MLSEDNESNSAFKEASELLLNCKYKIREKIDVPSSLELSIFSLNVSTLGTKIDSLRENIAFYENFDVLLFNETNCKENKLANGKNDLKLEGFYEPIIQDPIRTSGKGGGLIIYINGRVCEKENIESICPYNEPRNTSGEFQFVKIKKCKGLQKTVILGNVYRSPSKKPANFNIYFNKILEKLNNKRYSNKVIYIVGDFNQDLIQYENNIDSQNLVDSAHNNGFVQLVSRPTRLTEHSATLIDLTFTNNIDSVLSCNIITDDLSDHLAIHTKITLGSSTRETRTTAKKHDKKDYRIFTEANNQIFEQLIHDENWAEITENLGAQDSYDKLEEIYMKHYNTAYPLKSSRVLRNHERKNPKPWILPWLEDACARKNKFYYDFVKNPSPENKAKYIQLDKFCKNI